MTYEEAAKSLFLNRHPMPEVNILHTTDTEFSVTNLFYLHLSD